MPRKTKEETPKNSYTAKDIYVLEGLEPVRKRPGMYIGSTGPEGLHHLIWEVVDNSIDEAMAGHATEIEVRLLRNDMVSVEDNGRGFDPGAATAIAGQRTGIGLLGMRERLEALGGRLAIDSAPGRGARLIASIPGNGGA